MSDNIIKGEDNIRYSATQVAEMFDLPVSTVRHYMTAFSEILDLEYSNKIKELYIGKDTINKIIEAYKKSIIENEESIKKIYDIDKKDSSISFDIKRTIDLLETYKNKEPIQNVNKQVICVKYYANP